MLPVDLSIIVPAFNEEKLLGETLQRIRSAISGLLKMDWSIELIVCDNNSTDRTAELARQAGALVTFEPVNQIGRARNTGARAAQGRWLLFIDADSRPSPELFADLALTLQDGRCLAGGSTLCLDEPHLIAGAVTAGWNWWSRLSRWAPGTFIFCDAAVFRELGGFDEQLYAAEEIDLFRRLKTRARELNRTIVILHRYPLVTSARKMALYTPREHLRFLVRTVLGRGRTLRDPRQCFTWYDGRR